MNDSISLKLFNDIESILNSDNITIDQLNQIKILVSNGKISWSEELTSLEDTIEELEEQVSNLSDDSDDTSVKSFQ